MKPAILPFIVYFAFSLVALTLKIRFPVYLLLFAIINLGVFNWQANFLKRDPAVIIAVTVVVFVLGAIYGVVGILFFYRGALENQLAGAIMLANINNVVVIVFSSRFFGPPEPLAAAMYMRYPSSSS